MRDEEVELNAEIHRRLIIEGGDFSRVVYAERFAELRDELLRKNWTPEMGSADLLYREISDWFAIVGTKHRKDGIAIIQRYLEDARNQGPTQ